jgi:SAM-dependent methyltransferase
VELDGHFDLIWVGSLFTHLPGTKWDTFLRFLTERLAPNGLLVFTAHGPWYAEQIRQECSPLGGVPAESLLEMLRGFDETGFGFAGYPEFDDYGLSLSAPAEVTKRLQGLEDMRLTLYLERGWRSHQDVIAYQKGFTTPDL